MSERTEKMKQKQWVQIAAVFFGLMIVLTICSRAASSAVKARVTVTRASRQKISHEISLNGSVEAKNYVLQYVTSGLMVTGVQVSPGQQVEAGDVIFTVDMQKLQESIASIETELNRVDEKERLSVSRAEAAYQDVKANAEEEKARAYQTYEKAVAEYQNYINTHKKTAGVSAESTEERTMNEKAASVYDETVAKELENAVESEKSAYAAVVREQEKQISAAADAVQRTKEDLNLSQERGTLTLTVNDAALGTVQVNTLKQLDLSGTWCGTYFADYPITLTAVPAPGASFTGWSGDASNTAPTITLTMNQAMSIQANFDLG